MVLKTGGTTDAHILIKQLKAELATVPVWDNYTGPTFRLLNSLHALSNV